MDGFHVDAGVTYMALDTNTDLELKNNQECGREPAIRQ